MKNAHQQGAAPNASPAVVSIGELLWDRLPDGDHLGGAPANLAFHAGQLGAQSHVISRVGEDELGKKLLCALARAGLSTDLVQADTVHPTGVVQVELKDGQPQYQIRGAAWDHIEITEKNCAAVAQADAICFGTLAQRSAASRNTLRHLVQLAQPGAIRFFDLNLRFPHYDRESIEFGLRHATVLKLNEDELLVLANLFSCPQNQAMARLFEQYPLSLIALTLGARGSQLHLRERCIETPPASCQCVNPVGAGDAFSAAIVTGLLNQKPLEQIAQAANKVGAYVASQMEAMPPLPLELR